MAATEAPDVFNINTDTIAAGSLAVTELPDIASFEAEIKLISFAATGAPDTAYIITSVIGTSSFAVSEAKDTASVRLYGQWGELITPAATNWQLVA